MSTKILLPKGYQFSFNNAVGVLTENTEVEFAEDFDSLATEFHLAGAPVEAFLTLEHQETVKRKVVEGDVEKEIEVEVFVKYNANGTRFEFDFEVEPEPSREDELNAKTVAELTVVAEGLQIDPKGLKKAELVAAILAAESPTGN